MNKQHETKGRDLGEFKSVYDPAEEVRYLRAELAKRDAAMSEYKTSHGKLAILAEDIKAAVTPMDPLPMAYSPKQSKGMGRACEMVMQSSDGHHGANQAPNEIEGFNAFSPKIGEARQLNFARDVVASVERKRKSFNIPHLAHIVTGDMIAGDIHEELRVTAEWPAPVQAVEAGKLLAKQIAITSPHFENVTVHFVAADNHARLTKKPQAKEEGLNTLNYVVGEVAKAYTSRLPNVDFRIYPVHEQVINVNGRQYLACHGHGVQGWAGVPWYGIERKVGKEALARLQIIMEEIQLARTIGFHKYVFGHFHTFIDTALYSGAGSVQGTDAFDHKAGRYSKPSQPSWVVHPTHGEFDRTNWWLRDK